MNPGKTLLILRLSSIGDVVLTTSVLQRLKRELPGVKLVFVTKKSFSDILPDGIEVIEFESFNTNFISRLRACKPDAILDLHGNLRTSRIKWLFWDIQSFTIGKQRLARWIYLKTHWKKIHLRHAVERYQWVVDELMRYWGEGVNKGKIDGLWLSKKRVKNPLEMGDVGYGVLHLSATYNTKKIPNFIWQHIIANRSEPLVLLGGKEDKETANELLKMASNGWLVTSMVGETSMGESMKIVSEARWFIGGDTGFTHVAAAYGIPHLMVWGNTRPELGFAPFVGEEVLENQSFWLIAEGVSCAPCSRLGFDECPRKHFHCMMRQDLQKLDSVLQKMRNIG